MIWRHYQQRARIDMKFIIVGCIIQLSICLMFLQPPFSPLQLKTLEGRAKTIRQPPAEEGHEPSRTQTNCSIPCILSVF